MFKSIKLIVRRLAPASLVPLLRPIPYYLLEPFQPKLRTATHVPVPPLWRMFEGPRDKQLFLKNADEALEIARKLGQLRPNSKMLDIGSGLGRKTFRLIDYLGPDARYVGVDIVREGVDWCNSVIAPKHPHFVFLHLNVYNALYNRKATVKAADYNFPFADASFDLVTAWSVFTHMLPGDIENYLSEASRMLRPNGHCLFSFFIMTDTASAAVRAKRATEKIEHEIDGWFTNNRNLPEDVIAFREEWIRAVYERVGLEVKEILYGSWTGAPAHKEFPILNYQDIVVAVRR
jgi:SAM-dependent methyltransferase